MLSTPKIRLHAMAICLLAAAGPLHAATAEEATPAIALLGAREQLLAAFDAMPQVRLEDVFLRCARESSEHMLGLDEAVPCAMAWDTLLKREFGGDIDALLAWWRAHREDTDVR